MLIFVFVLRLDCVVKSAMERRKKQRRREQHRSESRRVFHKALSEHSLTEVRSEVMLEFGISEAIVHGVASHFALYPTRTDSIGKRINLLLLVCL